MILLCLFLLSMASLMFSGCNTRKTENAKNQETWMLMRLPDGNTVHTRIIGYESYEGVLRIWTEDREYITSVNNVCLIRDLE